MRSLCLITLLVVSSLTYAQEAKPVSADLSLVEVKIESSLDGTLQPNKLFLPESSESKPLLIFLHSWSHGLEQDNSRWLNLAKERNWAYLQPHFRGKNHTPEACGSELARQDILDAVEWVLKQTKIDRSRVYLAGTSGGGHMAMLMASYYPKKFSAVSSWVGISDLSKWHSTTKLKRDTHHYAVELEKCVGGQPDSSDAVQYQLKMRSPVHHLVRAVDVPLDINTGIYDGHKGSVPVSQSIEAFNMILRAKKQPEISSVEINRWISAGATEYRDPFAVEDSSYSRKIFLRVQVDQSRLTVFDGAHEDLPEAGMAFFESICRETAW